MNRSFSARHLLTLSTYGTSFAVQAIVIAAMTKQQDAAINRRERWSERWQALGVPASDKATARSRRSARECCAREGGGPQRKVKNADRLVVSGLMLAITHKDKPCAR